MKPGVGSPPRRGGNLPHKLSFFQFSGLREWHDVTVLMKPAYV
jgi:hypothetical protein